MSAMIGMDTGEVRHNAVLLKNQAESLLTTVHTVDRIVYQIGQSWHGEAAAQFIDAWQRQHRPRMLSAQQDLLGLAQSADNNVAQQAEASAIAGRAARAGVFGFRNSANQPQVLKDEQFVTQGINGKTRNQAVAWWNQLGPQRERELLATIPAFLATIPAFRPYMQQYAQDPTRAVDNTSKVQGSFQVDVVKKKFGAAGGAETSVEMVTLPSHHVLVTLSGGAFVEAAVGAGTGIASAAAGAKTTGSASITYEFGNAAEAKAFYDKVVGPNGTTDTPTEMAKNISEAVKATPDLHLVSEQYALSQTGSVDVAVGAGGARATIGVDANATYMVDTVAHTQTFRYSIGGQGSAGVDVAGVSAKGDLSVAVVAGSGDHPALQRIVISGQYGDSVRVGTALHNRATGSGGDFSVAIVPTEANSQHLASLLHDLASGNAHAAQSQLQALSQHATVVNQTDRSTTITNGFNDQVDLLVAKFGIKGTDQRATTTYTSTDVKPPGCDVGMQMPR
ncbi:MAG: hypothetical protein M0Z42_03205 [Actinomycetota bacterium]|jgi:uncharacterized protein YukE|nr:hypothetical protein [Actinomycetota bacterium]